MNHVAILDIGKTNKKCFVFDEDYSLVFERTDTLPETIDEDGEPCEDVDLLTNWIAETIKGMLTDGRFHIKAVNCSAYGASFVHLNTAGQPITPLYNYLKPFPEDLKKQFFEQYGGEENVALETASPVLGMLNSGMQLYWLKYYKSLIFNQIHYSLHLPQFICCIIREQLVGFGADSGADSPGDSKSPGESAPESAPKPTPIINFAGSEMTGIGCHTMLWNFRQNDYHDWVKTEGVTGKLPPIRPSDSVISFPSSSGPEFLGCGLHDSSAALIPYLKTFKEPFVLISTGTWCISMNPFNNALLTPAELAQDCLFYMTYEGEPVKSARYFGGNEHEEMVILLAKGFHKPLDYYKTVVFDRAIIDWLQGAKEPGSHPFKDYETAYHAFMMRLVNRQYESTRLVINKSTQKIFVDGGFSKNEVYLKLLKRYFPRIDIFTAKIAQATALGAALAIHASWNEKMIPDNLVAIKKVI